MSRMFVAINVLFAVLASPVSSQTISERCLTALEQGKTEIAAELANQLRGFSDLGSGAVLALNKRCVEDALAGQYVYDGRQGRFDLATDVAARQERLAQENEESANRQRALDASGRLARQTEADRLNAVIEATVTACVDTYRENPQVALINPICNDVFMSMGLPE